MSNHDNCDTHESHESLVYSKEVAKGSFWGLIGQGALKATSFIYILIIASMASPEDVGIFYLSFSVITIITIFSTLGLPGSLSRYVPYFEGKKELIKIKDLLQVSFVLLFIFGLLFAALVWIFADFLGSFANSSRLPDGLRLLSLFIFLNNIFSFILACLQGSANIQSMQFAYNVQNLVKLIFTIVLFYLFGPNLLSLSAAFLLSFAFAIILSSKSFYAYFSKLEPPGSHLNSNELLFEFIPFGIMISTINMFGTIIFSSDRILLGIMIDPPRSETIIGIYSVVVSFAGTLLVIQNAVGGIFFPVISRLAGKNDLVHLDSILSNAQRWLAFLFIPISLIFILFSYQILELFSETPIYKSGYIVFSLFSLGMLVLSFSYILSTILAAFRMIKIELQIALIGAVINIIFSYLLIQIYGMEGAALGSLITFIIILILSYYYVNKLFNFKFSNQFYRIIFAGLLTFLILLLIKDFLISFSPTSLSIATINGTAGQVFFKGLNLLYLFALICVSSLIFFSLTVLLRCFTNEDVSILGLFMEKIRAPSWISSLMQKYLLAGVAKEK